MNGLALCAGGGGLEAGLQIVLPDQYRTVCAVERQAYAAASLVARMETTGMDQYPIWDDVKTFDGKPWRGVVDIITGGYPCQPFSLAGKGLGEDDPRHLWPYFRRIVRQIKPRWCFFENVAAHLTRGYSTVKRELKEDGYRVAQGIFTAEEVGAPHLRERLFILAELADSPDTRLPQRGCSGQQAQPEKAAGRLVDEFERCSSSKKMGNSDCGRAQRARPEQSAGRNFKSGQELGDSHSQRKSQPRRPERQSRGRTQHSGEKILAHAHIERTQIPFAGQQSTEQEPCSYHPLSIADLWPAGPGEFQYEWEQPRTAKSGVGGVTYGVGQRAESLSLLGNGVVPASAAMAFVALWRDLHGY